MISAFFRVGKFTPYLQGYIGPIGHGSRGKMLYVLTLFLVDFQQGVHPYLVVH